MRLSELQRKEVINIRDGKRIGMIIDVIITSDGMIDKFILEDKKGRRFRGEELYIKWSQIIKIGDDIILIDTRNN